MSQQHKALHILNWFHGNICVKKCYGNLKKEKRCYDRMRLIIASHEDFLIYHKTFIKIMREKHKVCDISESLFSRSERDFWTRKL